MIGYLEGKFVELNPTSTFVDVNGVGYEVQISLNTYNQINQLKEGKLFTYLQVREDGWTLYGFADKSEKEAFQKLIAITGVGANTARMMLSSLTPADLYRIVASGDSAALERIKGIGAKTAQRILLELKGKVTPPDHSELSGNADIHNSQVSDALYALLGLGISKPQAEAALKEVDKSLSVEQMIREALKHI